MKKFFLLVVVFLQFIVLLGCEKNEKTTLDIFVDEFKEVYPKGYQLENGWYDVSMSTTWYKLHTGERKVSSIRFNGELEFDGKYYGTVKKSIFLNNTFSYDGFTDNVLQSESIEIMSNGTNFYRNVKKIKNQELVEKYSEGTEKLDEIYFSFSFGRDDENVHLLSEFITYDMYKLIEFNSIYNVLTIVWELGADQQGGKRTVTDKYWFDDEYKIIKLSRIERKEYGDDSKHDVYSVKVLQKCEEIDISVPVEYEYELAVDREDIFTINL